VVLSQPTFGSGGDGSAQGFSPAAFGSNGLLFATTLSCVVALLGLVVAIVALRILVRDGYGPFLRALLRGKRAGRKRGARVTAAARWDDADPRWDADDPDEYAAMDESLSYTAYPDARPNPGRRPPPSSSQYRSGPQRRR
jgi:hypothetical protein